MDHCVKVVTHLTQLAIVIKVILITSNGNSN